MQRLVAVRQKLARTFLCLPARHREHLLRQLRGLLARMQRALVHAETRERMRRARSVSRRCSITFSGSDAETLLDQLLAADLKTYLHELLMKQDQMSMAASIESRVPFLDHKLVEFAASCQSMKLRGLTTKYILRRAMSGVCRRRF